MADVEMVGMDDLIQKLEKLGDQGYVEDVGKKMVDAAYPMTEAAVKSALASVETGPYATGSVSASITGTGTKVNAYGVYAVARPTGRDSKGVSNGAKAAFLQYGSPKKNPKLHARPWRQKAVNSVQDSAVKTMEEVLKSEMELD